MVAKEQLLEIKPYQMELAVAGHGGQLQLPVTFIARAEELFSPVCNAITQRGQQILAAVYLFYTL